MKEKIMNTSNPAKQYFSNGKTKALSVMRIIVAVLLTALIITVLASDAKNINLGFISTPDIGTAAVGMVLIYFLPVFALLGMAILWAIALNRSSKPYNEGSLLRSASAASLTLSSLSFVAVLGMALILVGLLKSFSSGYSSSYRSTPATLESVLATILLILTIIGMLALMPTAVSRTIFYRNVQKSMNSDHPTTGGSALYGVMKIINAIVKFGIGVVIVILVISLTSKTSSSSYGSSSKASVIIMIVLIVLAFLVGAVSNIIEALIAFGFKKIQLPNATPSGGPGGYPYQQPYNPQTHYIPQPSYTPPQQQTQSVTQPIYDTPQQSFDHYHNPYENENKTISTDIPQPRTCPFCGAPIEGNIAFCGRCGNKL